VLPRGWGDVGLQLAIWFGFLLSYQLVRGLVDHDRPAALANGRGIIDLERHLSRPVVELTLQRLADSSHALRAAAAWTYWNSEFTVVLLALVWVYLRRHEHFARLRNTLVLAGLLALIGFAAHPTAPPRMFPRFGFRDTLDAVGGVNHGSGLVQLAANPYAAMPSLHSADALIVAVVLAASCRRLWSRTLWLLWPLWVWFCVMATANHFLLDVLAGIALGALALALVAAVPRLRRRAGILGP
jgi:membrane-associated phospholipid phosphatase